MPKPQFDTEWSPDVVIYTDAAVSEDGETAVAYALETTDGATVEEDEYTLDTNHPIHIAEYIAVLKAVSVANDYGYSDPVIYTDYEGVVEHVFGECDPSDEKCHTIKDKLVGLLQNQFNRWMLEHIPRELNTQTHSLANEAVSTA